jgi:hypothetical protein
MGKVYTDWRTVPDNPLRVGDEDYGRSTYPYRQRVLNEDDEDDTRVFKKEEKLMYVEEEVPIPNTPRATKYPFATMDIGQSVFYPAQKINGKAYKAAMAMGGRRGWKFIARRENDGIRIWRKE